jgi:D-sedoheptulose 7-phosphate isomerase
MTQPAPEREKASGVEALYPFLYTGHSERATVLQEVRRSTEEKAREIMALRDWLGHELASRLSACAHAMAQAFRAHGTLFAFGNGGSATEAQAMVQLFLHPPRGQPLPAFALTNDTAVVTALANDVGFDVVFARQIAAFGVAGDIAVGISTSGNAANVLAALEAGVDSFESSFGELGGCPVPAGATGNIATEDLVSMLHEMGVETGIDLEKLVAASAEAQRVLGRPLASHTLVAGPVDWDRGRA